MECSRVNAYHQKILTALTGSHSDHHYEYIQNGTVEQYFTHVNNFYRDQHKDTPRFFEIGAAFGYNLRVALGLGWVAKGIEINKKIIKLLACAKKRDKFHHVRDLDYINIIHGDALEYKEYHTHDIIYGWTPFKSSPLNNKLWKIVADQAKSGAILLACGQHMLHQDKRIKLVETPYCSNMWIKK